jgi:hypothetical protein
MVVGNGTPVRPMTLPAAATNEGLEPALSKVRRDFRLGLWLIVTGVAIDAGVIGLGFLVPVLGEAGGLAVNLVASAGFALILAGAVFRLESGRFLRRNPGAR